MFAPIPLPDSGNQVFKDVMDYFETLQKRKSQQAQFGQQLALSKQAESRAQQLLPYQIQQYKDTHNKEASDFEIQQMYHGLIRQALKDAAANPNGMPSFGGTPTPSPVPGAMPGGSPDAMAQPPQQPTQEDNQASELSKNASFPAVPGLGQLNDMMQQPQNGMAPPNASPGMPAPPPLPIMPGGATPPAPNPQAPMPNAAQSGAPQQPAPPQMGAPGQEIVLRQGNPALSKLDAVAGFVPGIPKPVTHFGANGQIYTQYPSGKVTMQQSAVPGMKTVAQETPEERQKREVETKVAAAQGVEGAKDATTMKKAARSLATTAALANQLDDLLAENPDLTGIGQGTASKLNLSTNPKIGEFTTTAGNLQAEIGRYASQRGGVQALKWASTIKPGLFKQPEVNQGMIDATKQHLRDEYERLNQEYKDSTGQDLPIKMPDLNPSDKKMMTFRNKKTGEVQTISRGDAKKKGML